jgi:heterodisulfide reductase subunit C
MIMPEKNHNIDFGYIIHEDRQIDYDKTEKKIRQYVRSFEPSFNICISCGACTATCSSGNYTDFNPRKIFTLIKRGEVEGLNNEIKKCMLCGKCFLVCPRGINTRNLILSIRKALDIYYGSSF